MSDDWYDAGYDEYMDMLEDSFSKDQAKQYTQLVADLYNEIHEEGFNFSLPRLSVLYALSQSAHSTIKADSFGDLEGVLQGLVPPADASWWSAGERPERFAHTLRRMEEPGLVELIWSEGGKRQTLLGAKTTRLGMAYGYYWQMIPAKDFIEFLASDGEWPPKEEAQYDLRPTGLFDGFTTETSPSDLADALAGFSSKKLFDRRQTVSFSRAYEAVMNHNALVCYQFLPEINRKNLTRTLLLKVISSAEAFEDSLEGIEHTNGWPDRYKKLKKSTRNIEADEKEWSNAVDDYVIRVAWLMIKGATDEQVINPTPTPTGKPRQHGSKYTAPKVTYGGSVKPAIY